jgi:hypothetical protein
VSCQPVIDEQLETYSASVVAANHSLLALNLARLAVMSYSSVSHVQNNSWAHPPPLPSGLQQYGVPVEHWLLCEFEVWGQSAARLAGRLDGRVVRSFRLLVVMSEAMFTGLAKAVATRGIRA